MHAAVNTVYVDRDLRVTFADGPDLTPLQCEDEAVLNWISAHIGQPVGPVLRGVLDGEAPQALRHREDGTTRELFVAPDRSTSPAPGCRLVARSRRGAGATGLADYLRTHHPIGVFEYRLVPPVALEGSIPTLALEAAHNAVLAQCNDAFARIHDRDSAESVLGRSLLEILGGIDRVRHAALEFGTGILPQVPIGAEDVEIQVPGTSVRAMLRDGSLWSLFGSRTENLGAVDARGMGLFERLSELVPAIVYAVDPTDLSLSYLNPRGRELLGLDPTSDPPMVESLLPLIHPDDAPITKASLARWRSAPAGESIQNRYRLRRSDGTWRWMLDQSQVCGWDGSAARMVIGATMDITEHEQASSAISEQTHQRMDADRLETVGLFSGGISHDFANVLAVIDTLVPMLRVNDPDTRNQGIALLQQATAQGHGLAGQLADFARGITAKRTRFYLDEDLRRFVSMVRSTLSRGGVRLPKALPRARVTAHRGQIHQVLLNLFLNARQATRRGDVRFDLTPEARDATSGYRLDVIDQGVGMSPEVAERIFEPHFSGPGGSGSGIGLAVVRRIVDDHQGSIEVETAPGVGTTISVWLPDSLPSTPPLATREDEPRS